MHRSNDLRAIRPEYKDILLNREVIAVDQDKLGRQGGRVKKDRNFEWWMRPLADNSYALAIWLRAIDQGWPQQVPFVFVFCVLCASLCGWFLAVRLNIVVDNVSGDHAL